MINNHNSILNSKLLLFCLFASVMVAGLPGCDTKLVTKKHLYQNKQVHQSLEKIKYDTSLQNVLKSKHIDLFQIDTLCQRLVQSVNLYDNSRRQITSGDSLFSRCNKLLFADTIKFLALSEAESKQGLMHAIYLNEWYLFNLCRQKRQQLLDS